MRFSLRELAGIILHLLPPSGLRGFVLSGALGAGAGQGPKTGGEGVDTWGGMGPGTREHIYIYSGGCGSSRRSSSSSSSSSRTSGSSLLRSQSDFLLQQPANLALQQVLSDGDEVEELSLSEAKGAGFGIHFASFKEAHRKAVC